MRPHSSYIGLSSQRASTGLQGYKSPVQTNWPAISPPPSRSLCPIITLILRIHPSPPGILLLNLSSAFSVQAPKDGPTNREVPSPHEVERTLHRNLTAGSVLAEREKDRLVHHLSFRKASNFSLKLESFLKQFPQCSNHR